MQQINGTYQILFKHPNASAHRNNSGSIEFGIQKFIGECDNFTTCGKCSFRNDKDELLLVDYQDIMQMFTI